MKGVVFKIALVMLLWLPGLSFAIPPTEVIPEFHSEGCTPGGGDIGSAVSQCEVNAGLPNNDGFVVWDSAGAITNTGGNEYYTTYSVEVLGTRISNQLPEIGYLCQVVCYNIVPEYVCDNPDFSYAVVDSNGDITDCIEDPCDGDPVEGPAPTSGEQAFYAAHGYSCTPASQGSCKIYPSAPLPGGGWMYFEHSEGGHCSTDEASDPDGTPTDSNTPGGDDPTDNGGYGQCGLASPYDPFCAGDPSADCPNGICRSGCGYYNADFICENPDYSGPDGSDYGGSAVPPTPPDGDSTGDGETNIDLAPAIALLQQIRTNTATTASNTAGGGSPETTPDYTGLLTEIRDQTKGDQALADSQIADAETDIAAAESENETNEENAHKADGTNSYFKVDSQDGEFHTALEGKTSTVGTEIGDMLGVAGVCPTIDFDVPNYFNSEIDVSQVQSIIRPLLTFFLWFSVGVQGYFIFFKWGLA